MGSSPSIFISHGSQDEVVARKIRNLFEDRGHETLLLKLQQSMSEDFIMELLRKEVKARDWLVVVDSAYAQASNWVSFEQTAARLYKKPVYHVDAACASRSGRVLDECLRSEVADISRKLRVFLSHSHADNAITQQIQKELAAWGFEVLVDLSGLTAGASYIQRTTTGIDAALENGAFVILVSANSVSSRWVEMEQNYALVKLRQGGGAPRGAIIPCMISPRAVEAPMLLSTFRYVDFTGDFDHGLEELRRWLQAL
jgi:hypothetical protein